MTKSLESFCISMLRIYSRPESIAYQIGALANHFVQYFGLSSYPNLIEIKLLLDNHHKLASIQPGQLGGLPGCHYLDEVKKLCIEYEATGWLGRNEFTIMHECYEAIQETFERLVPGYKAHRDSTTLCMKPYADRFAAAVLMQNNVFSAALKEAGLDVCSLRNYFNFYNRSYSSVAIRIKELLKPPVVDEEVDFMIAIYERMSNGKPKHWSYDCGSYKFVARCVVKTHGIRLSRSKRRANFKSYLLPRRLFPVFGEKPALGFIVDEVVEAKRPIYYENAMFDLLGNNEMALLARPVRWYGRIAKVILVVVRRRDSYLLKKQVDSLDNLRVKPSVYIS
jgi:hypothetical protein